MVRVAVNVRPPRRRGLSCAVLLGEEFCRVERVGLENGPTLGIEPPGSPTIVVQFDAVAIGVSEVNGNGSPVVLGGVNGVCAVQDMPHGAAQFSTTGVEEGEGVKSGMPLGGGVPPSLCQVFKPTWW